jgi:hypothetical protein
LRIPYLFFFLSTLISFHISGSSSSSSTQTIISPNHIQLQQQNTNIIAIMPSFSTILATSLAITYALAAPATQLTARPNSNRNNNNTSQWEEPQQQHPQSCLNAQQAQEVATKYGLLISSYTDASADAILTTNFTDYSQSVNTLINSCPQGSAAMHLPLEAPTFTSLQQFKMGQSQQPKINFEQLAIWTSCRSVTIRWRTTNTVNVTDLLPTATEGVRPVIGLITMEVTEAEESDDVNWKIHTVYSEFDAGAWLQNLMDADICHNPEKNLGAPAVAGATSTMGAAAPAAMTSAGTGPMAAVVSGSAGVVQKAPVATAAPMMKRARMYI